MKNAASLSLFEFNFAGQKKFFESFFDPVFNREFAKILVFQITFYLKQKKEKKMNSLWNSDENNSFFGAKKNEKKMKF